MRGLGAVLAALLLGACAGAPSATSPSPETSASVVSQSPTASAVSSCSHATPAQTEGPYFKAGSPERSSLLDAGVPGTRLHLTGKVLNRSCTRVGNAKLDFWQADASGAYDNSGYRFRGHEFSDAQGNFSLDTVVPGEYPGRTRHIHVKVQAPGGPVLTTQLYFPGESRNQQDSIFDQSLLLSVADAANGKAATFTFVLSQ
jgi:protocatechuate 3,4-dioxygenase beta subunit